MILYLDTSSLVKLYVGEEGSPEVRSLVDRASVVATSVVAYPETRSALARLGRDGVLSAAQLELARRDLLRDWESLLKVRLLRRVYERAGDLTEKHSLRGSDALHLASYLEVLERTEDDDLRFSAFDDRLIAAADAEHSSSRPEGR